MKATYTAKLAYDDDEELGRVGRGSSLENTKIVFSAVGQPLSSSFRDKASSSTYHSPSFALQDFERRYPSANMEKSPLPTKKRLKFFLKTLIEGSSGQINQSNDDDEIEHIEPIMNIDDYDKINLDDNALDKCDNYDQDLRLFPKSYILNSVPEYQVNPYDPLNIHSSLPLNIDNLDYAKLNTTHPSKNHNYSLLTNGENQKLANASTAQAQTLNLSKSSKSQFNIFNLFKRHKNSTKLVDSSAGAKPSLTGSYHESGDQNEVVGLIGPPPLEDDSERVPSSFNLPNTVTDFFACKNSHIPQLFERASPAWWNPRFDSNVLEKQLRKTSIPLIKRQFRIALCFIGLSVLVWSAYLAGAAYTTSWREITAACAGILTLLLVSLGITFTPAYDKYYAHLSILWSLGICVFSLITFSRRHGGYYIFNPNQRSLISGATLSFFANFTTSLQIIVLVYTFTNAPLLATMFLAGLYSVSFITLSALRLSDQGNLRFWRKEGTSQNIYKLLGFEILLHFCLHVLGIHIFLMNQVRLHSTFWQIGQSLIAKKSLELERKLKEKIIHSVMPPSVADELMQPNNEEELSSRRRKSSSFPLWHHHLHQQQLHAHIANPVTSRYTHRHTSSKNKESIFTRRAKKFFGLSHDPHSADYKMKHAQIKHLQLNSKKGVPFKTKDSSQMSSIEDPEYNKSDFNNLDTLLPKSNGDNDLQGRRPDTTGQFESAGAIEPLLSPQAVPTTNAAAVVVANNRKNQSSTSSSIVPNYHNALPSSLPSPQPATPTTTTTITATSSSKPLMIFRPFKMNKMDNVSILFADIVGFTQMSSNKSAAVLVALLNDLFGRFDKLCEACGCEKIATLGDCYYCVSGCPSPRPDHAVCCVRMGLSMIRAIRDFDRDNRQNVNMRVGIHTGTVLCGVVGTRRFKFDVWSNDVTLANKLESTGKPGRVHVSQTTVNALDDKYEYEEGEPYKAINTYFIVKPKNPRDGPIIATIPNRLQLAATVSNHHYHLPAANPRLAYNPSFLARYSRSSFTAADPKLDKGIKFVSTGTVEPSSHPLPNIPFSEKLGINADNQSKLAVATKTAPVFQTHGVKGQLPYLYSDSDLLAFGNQGDNSVDDSQTKVDKEDVVKPFSTSLVLSNTFEPAPSPVYYGSDDAQLIDAGEDSVAHAPDSNAVLSSNPSPNSAFHANDLNKSAVSEQNAPLAMELPSSLSNMECNTDKSNPVIRVKPYNISKETSAAQPQTYNHYLRSHKNAVGSGGNSASLHRQMSAGDIYSSQSSITDLVSQRFDFNHPANAANTAAAYYLFNKDTRILPTTALNTQTSGPVAGPGFRFGGKRIPSSLAKDVRFIQKQQKYDIHLVNCVKEDTINNKKNNFSYPPINFCCLTFKDPDLEYAYRHHLFTTVPYRHLPSSAPLLEQALGTDGGGCVPGESEDAYPGFDSGLMSPVPPEEGEDDKPSLLAMDVLAPHHPPSSSSHSCPRGRGSWTTFASPNFTLFTEVCVSFVILSMMFVACFILLDRPREPVSMSFWIFALLFEIVVIFYVGSEELPMFRCFGRRDGKCSTCCVQRKFKSRIMSSELQAATTKANGKPNGDGGAQKSFSSEKSAVFCPSASAVGAGIGIGYYPTRTERNLARSRDVFNRWWVRQVFGLVIASLPVASLLIAYFRISPQLRSAEAQYYDFLLVLALLHLINLVQLLSWIKALLSALVAGVIITFITLEFCARNTTLKILTMIQDPNERSKLIPAKLYYYINLPNRNFNKRLLDIFSWTGGSGSSEHVDADWRTRLSPNAAPVYAYSGPRLFHSASYNPKYLVLNPTALDSLTDSTGAAFSAIKTTAVSVANITSSNLLNLTRSDSRIDWHLQNLLNILKGPHSLPNVPSDVTKLNLTLVKAASGIHTLGNKNITSAATTVATAGLASARFLASPLVDNGIGPSHISPAAAASAAVYHITEEGIVETSRDNITTMPVFCLELIIGVALIFLLVVILNREFEINYRLNFKGRDRALRDKEIILLHKNQAEWLLHNIIPKHVVEQLKETSRYSKNHKNVGIIFATIVNFNELYDESFEGGKECLRVLNEVIGDFDELLDKPQYRDIEKIKTIGSTFMAASGLNNPVTDEEAVSLTNITQQTPHQSFSNSGTPKISILPSTSNSNPTTTTTPTIPKTSPRPNEHEISHLVSLMDFVLDMLNVVENFNRDLLEFNFVLRIGYNIGDVTAGVIGTTKLYYDIWGDAVNMASRMDTTGVPNHIQVPAHVVPILQDYFEFTYRGDVYAKGKGQVATYLVKGRL